MTTIHLSEPEIQQYVFDKMSCDTLTADHIQSCETCRIKAEAYQLIFAEIQELPEPVFDFNLADLVVGQLSRPKTKSLFDNAVIYITTFVSILLTAFAIYFFRDFLSGSLAVITPILLYLVITTSSSLLIFLGIDLFAKYNRRIKVLDFN